MPAGREQSREGESGVALLLAIWVLALLAVVAAAATRDLRSSVGLTRTVVDASQARAQADAGVWEALANLLDGERAKGLLIDGRPQALPITGGQVRLTIQDEAGKLDLNAAPEASLRGLFKTVGFDDRAADGFTRTLIAYRGALEEKALRERVDGQLPVPVFLTREELRLVPGIGFDVYNRVAPFVTVYGNNGEVHPQTASAEVLAAISGLSLPTAARQVEQRRQAPAVWPRLAVVTITSTATLPNGATFTRQAVVDIFPKPERLYQLLAWSAPR
jgi:general secretion pathway protein K